VLLPLGVTSPLRKKLTSLSVIKDGMNEPQHAYKGLVVAPFILTTIVDAGQPSSTRMNLIGSNAVMKSVEVLMVISMI
jgi:hypothetical protein